MSNIPFDAEKLDRYLEEAGVDVVLATSRHNVRYLLGGHQHHFFAVMDAIGTSRYLPIVVYERGHPEHAAYIGARNEKGSLKVVELEAGGLWTPSVIAGASSAPEAMRLAIEHLQKIGASGKRIGVETAFLPSDVARVLEDAVGRESVVDALRPLERLRAVKTPQELKMLRTASDLVVEAMMDVIHHHRAGTTKRMLDEALRRAETDRGLTFDYALITVGSSHVRAPSNEVWQEGDIISVDSGGNYHGYIGDLCRMGILGKPDTELEDLLGEVDRIQQVARSAIHPGAPGGDIYAKAGPAVTASLHRDALHFVAHGMGLVSHEAPRIGSGGTFPYPPDDAGLPLEPGMVLSIETTLMHKRGFIKLEDTVAVTAHGWEGFGDRARGWNIGGVSA